MTASTASFLAFALAGLAAAGHGCGGERDVADAETWEEEGGEADDGDSPDEEDGEGPEGEPEIEDDEGSEADGVVPTTLTVLVTGSAWWDPAGPTPLPGALVALDGPDGRRTERTTGPDGRTTFDGLDFSMGPLTLTGWRDGFVMVGRAGIMHVGGEVHIDLPLLDDVRLPFVWLSGTAVNVPEQAGEILLSATVPSWRWRGPGPSWEMGVLRDLPFTVVGVAREQVYSWPFWDEVYRRHGWVVLEQPAARRDRSGIVLDFATGWASRNAGGTFALPPRRESPLRTNDSGAYLRVTSIDSGQTAELGHATRLSRSADGSTVEYEIEYVTPPGVSDPLTVFALSLSWPSGDPPAEWAQVRVAGYPAGGPVPVPFLDAPRMLSPANRLAGHPLDQPLAWEVFDRGVGILVQVARLDSTGFFPTVIWTVRFPDDSTSVTLPELPLAMDPRVFLGRYGAHAYVVTYREAESGRYAAQETRGSAFVVVP